jgi:hypothetical protein
MSSEGDRVDFPRATLHIKRIAGDRLKFYFDGQNNGGSNMVMAEFVEAVLRGRRQEAYAPWVPDSEEWKNKRRKLSGDDDSGKDDESGTGAGSGAKPRDKDHEEQDRGESSEGGESR